jgi:hypothetical protein
MAKKIELLVLDHEEFELDRMPFDTIKDAREWVTTRGLDPAYWDRRAEVAGWAEQIDTIQLLVDGDVHSDWFPKFKCAH